MNKRAQLQVSKKQRAGRTRAPLRLSGYPRLAVHRTNRFIYAQLIDDATMKTVCAFSSKSLPKAKRTKIAEATAVGEAIGKMAKDKGFDKIVFDRGSYRYHGRVKAVAEAVRAAGLKF